MSDYQRKPTRKVSGLVTDGNERTPFKKFTDTFFEEDFSTVKKSIAKDVIIPTVKNLLADICIGSIERALFGTSRSNGYRNYGNSLVRTHTASSSSTMPIGLRSSLTASPTPEPDIKKKLTLDDLVMRDRPAAQDLIDALRGEIYDHGSVTIAELYEIVSDDNDIVPTDFTNNYYGWTNLDGAYVKPFGNMFKVILPKPEQLD